MCKHAVYSSPSNSLPQVLIEHPLPNKDDISHYDILPIVLIDFADDSNQIFKKSKALQMVIVFCLLNDCSL